MSSHSNSFVTGYIYLLLDPDTLIPRYVGQTVYPESRLKEHLRDKEETYKCHWIQSLLKQNKFPIFEIIESDVPIEDLNWAEIYRIAFYRFLGYLLTNLTDGGEGTRGYRLTEEQLKRLSDSQKGRKSSEESNEKRRRKQIGKKRPSEIGKKISIAMTNKVQSRETREKRSGSMMGKPGGMLDKKHSEETRAKQRQSHLGKEGYWAGKKQPEYAVKERANQLRGKPSPLKGRLQTKESNEKRRITLLKFYGK